MEPKIASKGVCILISKKTKFKALDVNRDKEGRWLIVSGEMLNQKITLVNLYAPNAAQANFLTSINILLAKYTDTLHIIGGDFNSVCNASLDRSSHPLPADKASSRAFAELLDTHG
uniref:Endonuclease/exonuclease/phosphatase domain-containing protein n=1 Tax=Neogobius melanostomus TaxID=47308 RepID=A0A8C6SQB4_9GOBI